VYSAPNVLVVFDATDAREIFLFVAERDVVVFFVFVETFVVARLFTIFLEFVVVRDAVPREVAEVVLFVLLARDVVPRETLPDFTELTCREERVV
jgi:hypothetical protein